MSAFARLAEQIAAHSDGPVFGVPGSGATLSLIDELEKRGREFVLTHFEGAAAMMAGTVGRLSGRAGVCLSIKGPGLANMVPGLAVSAYEAFPLVAIAEAYGAAAPAAKAHKRIDQAALTRTVSKGITQLTEAGPAYADLAALAEAEVPGPVILELAQPAPEKPAPLPAPARGPSGADDTRVLAMVEKAERPIVVVGTLAIRRGLSEALNALNVPVFSTAAAKGVVDETLPQAAGVYTGAGLELSPEHGLFADADLVICVGMRPHEVLATKPFPCPAVNIAATSEPGEEAFSFEAAASTRATEDALTLLKDKRWGEEQVADALDRLFAAALSNRFMPAQVFRATQAHFEGAVRGVFDTGYFCTIAEHLWRPRDAACCLMSGQGRYMGTGLPMGLAAALHDQSLPTVAFVGDGGIGPFVGEIKLAVERKLPLLLCLLSDGYLSSIRTRALKGDLTQRPVTIARPSWLPVMEGFGMPVYAADNERAFADALSDWQPAGGPAFLEVAFEPDAYEAMVQGIR